VGYPIQNEKERGNELQPTSFKDAGRVRKKEEKPLPGNIARTLLIPCGGSLQICGDGLWSVVQRGKEKGTGRASSRSKGVKWAWGGEGAWRGRGLEIKDLQQKKRWGAPTQVTVFESQGTV